VNGYAVNISITYTVYRQNPINMFVQHERQRTIILIPRYRYISVS